MNVKAKDLMLVLYRNHKGEVSWRYVMPLSVPPQKSSEWHPGEWTFLVWDVVKQAERSFAYSGILWCGPYGKNPPTHVILSYGKPPAPPELK